MLEDDLYKHGYYLHYADGDRLVQVRNRETDEVLLQAGRPYKALEQAALMLKQHPQLSRYGKRPAVLKPMSVTVTASSDQPYYLARQLREIAKLIDQGKTGGSAAQREGTYEWKLTVEEAA